ncbi:hypothetical protein [Pseudomonas monteilii]|uniref:hypothetical protein n=1 Tax=Pseudomonas monteilii TaxID=76759 RepID=UPI003906CCC6
MTTQPAPSTFQERFARACEVATFALDKGGPCYLLWEVDQVQAGQRVKLDGVFFTEEEARISADLLRGTMRGARASMWSYAPNWNPDPAREASIRLEALQCREKLARRLGVHMAMPKEAV